MTFSKIGSKIFGQKSFKNIDLSQRISIFRKDGMTATDYNDVANIFKAMGPTIKYISKVHKLQSLIDN